MNQFLTTPFIQSLRKNGSDLAMLILFFVAMAFTPRASQPEDALASKPNVIIILIDDAGYADFGFMGSKDLVTPNIDQLAAQSIQFTDAHVSATVCSPSRAGLLTGKYQQRFGYECNEGDGYTGMDTTQVLMAKRLLDNGYTTAAFGKWHLGFKPEQHPLKRGFEYYYGFLSGGRSYFYAPNKDDKAGSKNALLENHQPVKFDGYLTDVLAEKAAAYIAQHKQQPFFMYWAPNAVHTPMQATQDDMNKFANHPRQKLAAMTFALDRAVGKIVSALKQQGLYENTLIFFLSDNGGAHNNQSSNFPLKGFKGNKFEAGHRIPFLMSWPKQFAGGNTFSKLTSSLDIFPTVLEAAGVPPTKTMGLDGISLLPFVQDKKNQSPHEWLVWRKDAAAAIRYLQFKMIRVKGLGERMYNLETDPGETTDLRLQHPHMFATLKTKLEEWEKDKIQPAWTEGAVWDTITLMIHDDLMNNREVRVKNPEELEKFELTNKPAGNRK